MLVEVEEKIMFTNINGNNIQITDEADSVDALHASLNWCHVYCNCLDL